MILSVSCVRQSSRGTSRGSSILRPQRLATRGFATQPLPLLLPAVPLHPARARTQARRGDFEGEYLDCTAISLAAFIKAQTNTISITTLNHA